MKISVPSQSLLHGLVIVLISAICKTSEAVAAKAPCQMIRVSNTKSHPAEEGVYHLSPSATCPDNTKWIWSMKERENYIYYSSDPFGWRIGAVMCRGNKAALYSEGETDTPLETKPRSWREWNVDTNAWEAINLKFTCLDGKQSTLDASLRNDDNVFTSNGSTSIGRVVTYVAIVVLIIGCVFMFLRKKQRKHHII